MCFIAIRFRGVEAVQRLALIYMCMWSTFGVVRVVKRVRVTVCSFDMTGTLAVIAIFAGPEAQSSHECVP